MPNMRNAERLLFKYFYKLKAYKHLVKSTANIDCMSDASVADVSFVLSVIDYSGEEQEIIIKYGMKGHAPKIRGTREYSNWVNAMHKIHDEFIRRGLIQNDELYNIGDC